VPLIYVTGISCGGQSTVRAELQRRGFEACGTDEDGMAYWVNEVTGAITRAAGAEDRTEEFTARNERRVDPERIRDLADRGRADLILVCGSVGNEGDVWDLFAMVVHLAVDEATMRRRVATRTTNEFAKNPHELALPRRMASERRRRSRAVRGDQRRRDETGGRRCRRDAPGDWERFLTRPASSAGRCRTAGVRGAPRSESVHARPVRACS
jgi:hypothetical protein